MPKFDVVIGNPPYQSPGKINKKSSGNKLWPLFIKKGSEILNENGIMFMIVPSSWTSGGQNVSKGRYGVLKDTFSKRQLIYANFNGIKEKYFPKIGLSSISYFIFQNKQIEMESVLELSDGETIKMDLSKESIISPVMNSKTVSLFQKMMSYPEKFNFFSCNKSKSNIQKDIIENQEKTNEYFQEVWIMGSDKTNDLLKRYINRILSKQFLRKKLLLKTQTRYWSPYFSNETQDILAQSYILFLNDNESKENVYSVFYSKLFTFLCYNLQIKVNGFMKTNIVKNLPKVDLTRSWTDEELYKHFNLTEDEIKFIEEQVK